MHKFTSSYSERESKIWIVLRMGKSRLGFPQLIIVFYHDRSKLQDEG